MEKRYDLLLMNDGDSVVDIVIAPYCEAEIGSLVEYEDRLGKVEKKISYQTIDSEVMQFIKAVLPVFEAKRIYRECWCEEEKENA